MAFTYDDTLGTDLGRVRFHLGDVVENAGPRPDDANFADAELNGLITVEGSWHRAVAGGFERLAVEWLRYPTFKADGLSLNRSDIAKGYQKLAATWRARFGSPTPTHVVGAIRKDGYSDDISSTDVTVGGEYKGSFRYIRPK